jgi:hypothetical protein
MLFNETELFSLKLYTTSDFLVFFLVPSRFRRLVTQCFSFSGSRLPPSAETAPKRLLRQRGRAGAAPLQASANRDLLFFSAKLFYQLVILPNTKLPTVIF